MSLAISSAASAGRVMLVRSGKLLIEWICHAGIGTLEKRASS